jgi:hypothetical protein
VLDKEYDGKIDWEPVQDIEVTGNFEITLMQTRQLIHSKRQGGLGKCETDSERDRLRSILNIYFSYLNKKAKQKKP